MEFRREREPVLEPEKEETKEIEEMVDRIERVFKEKIGEVDDKKGIEGIFWTRTEGLTDTETNILFKGAEPTKVADTGKVEEIRFEIPEILPNFLEKVLNGLIERYKEKKEFSSERLGLLISFLINRTVERYSQAEKEKGKEWKEIEPVKITLDTRKVPLDYLGFRNPEHCELTLKTSFENPGWFLGEKMKGGKITVEGRGPRKVGERMEGGEIIIKGDCKGWVGEEMKGGKIRILGYCNDTFNAEGMTGGILCFEGGVAKIHPSALTEDNRGKIYIGEESKENRIHPIDNSLR